MPWPKHEPVNGDDDDREDYPKPPPQKTVSQGSPKPRNPDPRDDD